MSMMSQALGPQDLKISEKKTSNLRRSPTKEFREDEEVFSDDEGEEEKMEDVSFSSIRDQSEVITPS